MWRWWELWTGHGSLDHSPALSGPSPTTRSGYFSPDGRYFQGWWGRRMWRKCTDGRPPGLGRRAARKPSSDAGRRTQDLSAWAWGGGGAACSLESTVSSSRVAVGSTAESRGELIWLQSCAESFATRRKPPWPPGVLRIAQVPLGQSWEMPSNTRMS